MNVLFFQLMMELMRQHLFGVIEPRHELAREIDFSKISKDVKTYGGKEFIGRSLPYKC